MQEKYRTQWGDLARRNILDKGGTPLPRWQDPLLTLRVMYPGGMRNFTQAVNFLNCEKLNRDFRTISVIKLVL